MRDRPSPIEFLPVPPGWLDALAEGDAVFTERYSRRVAEGWAGFPEALPALAATVHDHPDDPWGPHLVLAGDGTVIGLGGWKGAPRAGEAELGYAVAPVWQGQGVATELAGWLIERGRRAGVVRAVAHTLARESPSTGVLRRCGFRLDPAADEVAEQAAGPTWRWERLLTERLTLEPLAADHAAELFDALDHDDVGRYIGGPEMTTLDALRDRIAYLHRTDPSAWGERWLNWIVRADVEAGRPIVGRVEATVHLDRTPRIAEVAYVFDPRRWGHGFATESTRWMLTRLADEHDVEQAWATVDPRNGASISLLRRLAFVEAELPAGGIGSYDNGDLVFARRL